jgi:hypothetical protein
MTQKCVHCKSQEFLQKCNEICSGSIAPQINAIVPKTSRKTIRLILGLYCKSRSFSQESNEAR